MSRKSNRPKKSNPSSKPAANGKHPPATYASDTRRVGNTWMIQLHDGKYVRAPMLHEEFPGGESVRKKLLAASSRARELIQEAKRKPSMSPNEALGIETERAHFRFNQIIKESRALLQKGLAVESRNNLMHARKLLDNINEQRDKLGLAPLSPKEFMSFQRPLTPAESIQLLIKGKKKSDKRIIQRRMVRALKTPEQKLIKLLYARIEQLDKGNTKLRKTDESKIIQWLKLPATEFLRVMNGRIRELSFNEKMAHHLGKNPQTVQERLAALPARMAKLPASTRKDALTLLEIARKGLELERVLRKKGKTAAARTALKIFDDAFRTFGELLSE